MTPEPGQGVDASGGPVVDPTQNVIALVVAESKRQDDLRAAAKELSDTKIALQKEISDLRSQHEASIGQLREGYQEKISKAEAGRLDSIRQVDREEVAKTAVAANTAIAVLAKQTTDLATTLDKKVTDTATAAEQRNSAVNTDFNKRIAALELSSSEGKGKQTVADPQMEKLTTLVELLARNQDRGGGKGEGIETSWKILIAVIGIVFGFLAWQGRQAPSTQSQPQVIVVPAGTPTPGAVQSGPPTQVTR